MFVLAAEYDHANRDPLDHRQRDGDRAERKRWNDRGWRGDRRWMDGHHHENRRRRHGGVQVPKRNHRHWTTARVDTPEVHTSNDPAEFEGVPNDDAEAACLRDWGHKASEFAWTELAGERVTVFLDRNEGPRDRYDRQLVYVRDDGTLFNYRLVAQGYARVYDSQFTKRDRFYAAESRAQQKGVGLWECRNGQRTTRPETGGGGNSEGDGGSDGSRDLTVTRIHADADGNDHDNLNDEYVVLKNSGNDGLDLSGWTVSDEGGHTYRVPSGVRLASGETVTLYTGSGSNSASELYWGSGSAV
ncbi:lamin tail domain-containing protein [Haladaptatus halobius]|uniref:lamin tail domain-containing protein n=1 Tax=Haladaptatus halobius TaxID=2884875 RepID=UPI001D0AC19E|nr:lamin tail domain-containing protein [Haladaptatus halobius]